MTRTVSENKYLEMNDRVISRGQIIGELAALIRQHDNLSNIKAEAERILVRFAENEETISRKYRRKP